MNRFGRLSFYKVAYDEDGTQSIEVEKLTAGIPKHPTKVHVWAGISSKGPTSIIIFDGIMDKFFYTSILEKGLLPFIKKKYPNEDYRFQQDNDPKHKSKHAIQFLDDNKARYWPTPAESPDLNAIENVWAYMKWYLRSHVKPTTKSELVNGIQEFWKKKMNATQCKKFVGHIKNVIPVVIEKKGAATAM